MFLRVATVVGVGLAGLVVGSMIDLRVSGGQAMAQYNPPPPMPYPPQSYPPQQSYPAGRQLPPPVQADQDDDLDALGPPRTFGYPIGRPPQPPGVQYGGRPIYPPDADPNAGPPPAYPNGGPPPGSCAHRQGGASPAGANGPGRQLSGSRSKRKSGRSGDLQSKRRLGTADPGRAFEPGSGNSYPLLPSRGEPGRDLCRDDPYRDPVSFAQIPRQIPFWRVREEKTGAANFKRNLFEKIGDRVPLRNRVPIWHGSCLVPIWHDLSFGIGSVRYG